MATTSAADSLSGLSTKTVASIGNRITSWPTIASTGFFASGEPAGKQVSPQMKAKILAAATAIVMGAATAGHAADVRVADSTMPGAQRAATGNPAVTASTSQSLNALLAEWKQAGFTPPSKPAQYRVYGRNGYVTTGPGYAVMVSSIRAAVAAVRDGRETEAAANIDRARSMLASVVPVTSTVADR